MKFNFIILKYNVTPKLFTLNLGPNQVELSSLTIG